METKVCTKCIKEKEVSNFNKLKAGKYGVSSICKNCANLYGKIYRQRLDVKEKNRIKEAEWRKNNPELFKIRAKKTWEKNKHIFNERRRNRYKNDIEYRKKLADIEKKYKASGRRGEVNRLNPNTRDRINRYRINNPDKIRNKMKLYREEIWNEHEKEQRNNLEDAYVIKVIKKQTKFLLKTEEIPKDLVELKRQSMKLKRQIKNK